MDNNERYRSKMRRFKRKYLSLRADVLKFKNDIAMCKNNIHSENSDYLTGYQCALSMVEGMLAEFLSNYIHTKEKSNGLD